MAADLELDEGEYRRIYASYSAAQVITLAAAGTAPSDGVLDVSGASFTFAMKSERGDTAFVAQVANGSFKTNNAASGVVRFDLDAAALADPGTYMGQLKTTYSATDVDIKLITIFVRKAVS